MFLNCSKDDNIKETENLENPIVTNRLFKEKSGDFENKYIFDSNNALVKIQFYYYGSGFIPGLNTTTNLAGEVNIGYENGNIVSAKSHYNNGEINIEYIFNYANDNLKSIVENISIGNDITQIKTELEYDSKEILNKILIYRAESLSEEYNVVIDENGNLSEISNDFGSEIVNYDNKPSPYKNFSLASKFLTMAGIKAIFSNNNETSSNIEMIYNSDDYPSQIKRSYLQPNSTVFITIIDYEYELFND